MIDSSIQRIAIQHWRSAMLLSASVMLSACVATPGGSSSSQTADNSSSTAISSEASSAQSSSTAPASSSSVAPSSSSVAPSSSSVAPISSSSVTVSSSPAPVCEEPDTTQFDAGEIAYNAGSCTNCHGAPSNNGKTLGNASDPIDATKASYEGKTMAQFIVDKMTPYMSNDCKQNAAQCAEDIAHYLKIATGAEPEPVASCEEPSSSVASSAPIASSSSSAAPSGPSLLTSSGTFANGMEDFTTYFDNANYATASFSQEANFTINTTTSMAWHVQLVHPLSVVAGEQYTICMDAKAASNRSISVEIDNGPTQYQGISGGPAQFSLTTSYQSFESTFFADATDTTARLVINMGLDDANVQLDNIAVYAGDSCTGGNPTQSSSSQVSSQPAVSSSSQGTTSSVSNPGSGDFIIDDDFEGQAAGTAPAGWKTFLQYQINNPNNQSSGSMYALIDSSKAHSGTNSVRIKTGGMTITPSFIFQDLPDGKDAFYTRFWMNIPVSLGGGVKGPDGNHTHFMAYSTEMSGSNLEELRFGTLQDAILGAFLPSSIDAGTENVVPSASIPANQWVCLEFAVVKNAVFDQVYAWMDDQPLFEATSAGDWARNPGKFFSEATGSKAIDNHVSLGWRSFGDNKGVENIWFDDIAVSSEGRIGCN